MVFAKYNAKMQGKKFVSGESSPSYLLHPLAAERAFRHIPNAKIIVLLRNPVDRAYSHYCMNLRHGFETLSFEEAIEFEEKRIEEELKFISHRGVQLSINSNLSRYSYLHRGKYVDQIKPWFRFFTKEQIIVVKSEKLFNDINEYRKILDFLSIPRVNIERFENMYYGKNKPKYPKMNYTTRKRLKEYYKPHNERLYKFLNKDFGWDK
ncbi:MAG: sulfotransferase domain-containing protein [Gillisia sp.]